MHLNTEEEQNVIVWVAFAIVLCAVLCVLEFVLGWIQRVWYVVSCRCVR